MCQTVLLIKIGLMGISTFAVVLYFSSRAVPVQGVAQYWYCMTLQPIIIGLGLAYLLNPVIKFQERHCTFCFLKKKMKKSEKSAAKVGQGHCPLPGQSCFFW